MPGKGSKVLKEKRGRLPLSDASKQMSEQQEDKEVVAEKALSDLVREIEAYAEFVLQAAKTLHDITHNRYESRTTQTLQNIGVYKKPKFEDEALITYGIIKNVENARDKLRDLRTAVDLNSAKEAEKDVTELNKLFTAVAKESGLMLKRHKEIDPKKAEGFAAKNNTMLNRIVDRFISCINRLKSTFGFHDSLKKEIVGGLKTTLDNAKASMKSRLD